MKLHPALPDDYRPGVCYETGLDGAASAAGQVASTALQVSELDKARQEANRAGQTAATNISAAGANAAGYYKPYVAEGTNMLNSISGNSAYNSDDNSYVNNAENDLNQNALEQTPGYQWQYGQGMQAATNSAAARGLANSGAALKGASTFANGLADSTYQNQFNDQLSANSSAQGNLTNEFNRQNALLGYGSQAAGAAASNAYNTGVASNQALMEGATGSVAATTGIGNALQSGVSGLGNTASQYSMYNSLLNGTNQGFAGSYSGNGYGGSGGTDANPFGGAGGASAASDVADYFA